MNKLLILNGSPTRNSNTDILCETVAGAADRNGFEANHVLLNEYSILPCQACAERENDDLCIFHDDIHPFLYEFAECDAVVAATPIFFDTVSAQLKLFIDRCNCFRPMRKSSTGGFYLQEREWKKRRGAAVLVGGPRQKYQSALTVIKGFFIWCGVEFVDHLYYSHESWEPGAVRNDTQVLNQARDLGAKLTS